MFNVCHGGGHARTAQIMWLDTSQATIDQTAAHVEAWIENKRH